MHEATRRAPLLLPFTSIMGCFGKKLTEEEKLKRAQKRDKMAMVRSENAQCVWRFLVLFDVLVFLASFAIACLVLKETCSVVPGFNVTAGTADPNSADDVQLFVLKDPDQGCVADRGEVAAAGSPYPWAMLFSSLCFLFGKLTAHLLRLFIFQLDIRMLPDVPSAQQVEWRKQQGFDLPKVRSAQETSSEACGLQGCKLLLKIIRAIMSQAVSVMLLLFVSFIYIPSAAEAGRPGQFEGAFAVHLTPSLTTFMWVMIVVPSAVLLVTFCGCAVVSGGECDIDCSGDNEGMVAYTVLIGLICSGFITCYGLYILLEEKILPAHGLVTSNATAAAVEALLASKGAGGGAAAAAALNGTYAGRLLDGSFSNLGGVGAEGGAGLSLSEFLRGFVLWPQPTLPDVSAKLGAFSPLFVALVTLNILQAVVALLARLAPLILRLMQCFKKDRSSEGQSQEVQFTSNGNRV